ncbi:MAG: hypothetical protein ACRC9P_06725 [Bacteroides sp.]
MWVNVETSSGYRFVINKDYIAYMTEDDKGKAVIYFHDDSCINTTQTLDEWIEMLSTGDFND